MSNGAYHRFSNYSTIPISRTSKGNEKIGSRNREVRESRVKLQRNLSKGKEN